MRPKKSFTRIPLIVGTLLMATAITSCDNDTLTPRLAKKALEKEAMFADSSCVKSFNTGFYEVNPSELAKLKQLHDAGMIELATNAVVEKKEVSNYNYWSGYTTASQNVEHIFATVSLTEAAKKYEVHHVVKQRDDNEKDLELAKGHTVEPTPEYMMSNNDLDTGDDIEEIVKSTAEAEEKIADNTVTNTGAKTGQPAATPSSTPLSSYESALAKSAIKTHDMLLGNFELVKVKEVFCPEDMKENGIGSCSYIYRFVNKTPFGHVFGAPEANKLTTGHATFRNYVDMGWLVDVIK